MGGFGRSPFNRQEFRDKEKPRVKTPKSPFDIRLNDEQRTVLGLWFAEQLRAGLDARQTQESEVDHWHSLYEQARTRNKQTSPWPDAADLTSYIPCEKVDSIQARGMKTVFTNPVYVVEGWGAAADRAPFVEEFHQWKLEEERFQSVADRLWLISLIEPRGLLEVYEDTTIRRTRKQIKALCETDPITGGLLYDEDGQPMFQTDDKGKYIEAQDDNQPCGEVVIDSDERVRIGPQYRILPYRDSVILPGHAREKQDVWGYGKRFWKRYLDVLADAEEGIYDKKTVERLTTVGDREGDTGLARANQAVAPTDEVTAEKELWELLVLVDLNAVLHMRNAPPIRGISGSRWYVVTVHESQQLLLRINHDDVERSRYVPVILFPRPDRATEGFSFVGHKLITTTEEHTAWRNMSADRGSMVLQTPIKRMQGALWDPQEQPFGPKAVIDVRQPNELEPFVLPEFGLQYADNRIQTCERTAERLAGVNDIASGQVSQESRTLGEVNMATEQSFVRMDLIIRRFQEAMEDIFQIRHAIWKRTLAEEPDGIDAPQSLLVGLEGRGTPIEQFSSSGKITAALLEGSFRGKPYGSVQTADPGKRRADLVQFMQGLPMLMQVCPAMAMQMQTPQAQRALFREFLQAFNVQNKQAFLGSPAQDMAMTLQGQMGMPGMGMTPPGMGQPGMQPPVLPPMGGGLPQMPPPMPPGAGSVQ